ncbi:hypothetical protein [Paenibacillus pini]|uniref:Uncharacterized protein n=1 Tax=Paenibacillus pini JCM 16418 TaxID=1236976 RepID=W7YCI1_9BACL|nr:hypothetical protein [Paenibacillus pini]GAF06142.1 hypothetical protein JCM16418_87 [Paenibacillus pini JCM 16418]
MNSWERNIEAKSTISVQLTPDEALALTGVKFNGNAEVGATARRKIRAAFEKKFDFQHQDKVDYQQ